ncbi:RecQ family ATP-dependent DNA helicase [Planococcus halotolerans]|uniref:ATP-dependent DNA helicase n=1 Tax=Planococcus halotolerans TaxID=2233542 RepID=A0A365L189_9BACL|nr:ATP-dependent DNA helicase RecQ [Planococcus halotolerans]QHJ71112.1 RecQ family ATP-dependent DNA helicase [Planococcus halotolerans]RAZ79127.1 ATP-dependent DNA helicase [Planococcus halotolerans]
MNLEKTLFDAYGFTSFRPGQKEVIEKILAGQDVIALLPTGMGKSMCYQLPAHLLEGSVLIVSPLLSLMQDQVAQLKKMGEKSVTALNSFLDPAERSNVLNNLSNYRFIFISPEMLVQPYIKNRLRDIRISLLVADEAHCISQWGFDFRPDYLRIAEILPVLGHPRVLALTATATAKVTEEIKNYLDLSDPYVYTHPMDRKNIAYDIRKFTSGNEKLEWLKLFVSANRGPGIIYAGTRKKSQELSGLLNLAGIRTAFYHGGMEHQDRIFVQQQFQNGELEWVCSTNAFGMGVHIPDISHVIHYQVPTSIEGYVQEVGRAGRDGSPALATLLYAAGDEELLESLVLDDLPTENEIREIYRNADEGTQLVEQGIVRETSMRVISYWKNHLTEQETIYQIEQQKIEKMKQSAKIRKLIFLESCIREYLMECFDQQLQNKPANCCVNDGLDYNKFLKQRESRAVDLSDTWENRLNAILQC